MGLWGRKKEPAASEPDATFAFLTGEQGVRLRQLAQQAFAEAGTEVVAHPDYLQGADGQRYGLSNLAAQCHNDPAGERARPALVREHVRRMLSAASQPTEIETLPTEQVLARTYLRLMGQTSLPPESAGWYSYARPVCGDLVELLAFDSPETVSLVRDRDTAQHGLDAMRAAGLENLLREPIGAHDVLDGPDGVQLYVLQGESVYTASKLLVLPDVLTRTFGDRPFPNGLLVGVPFRHQLALYPLDDHNVLQGTSLVARFTVTGFQEGVGPVSPFVYWWNDGQLTQISRAGEDGNLIIDASGDFGDLVARLTG